MRKRNLMLAVALVAVAAAVVAAAVLAVGAGDGSHSHPSPDAKRRSAAASPSYVAVASGYLGMSRAQLAHELASGRTLAQIANATSGRSARGLIDTILAKRAARIHARASADKTSRARAARKLARLRRRITAAVDKTRGGD